MLCKKLSESCIQHFAVLQDFVGTELFGRSAPDYLKLLPFPILIHTQANIMSFPNKLKQRQAKYLMYR